MEKIKLGELLLARGILTDQQLQEACAKQKATGHKLGKTLLELNFITEKQLLPLLAEQLGIVHIELDDTLLNPKLANLLPETYARRFNAIILNSTLKELTVGMADPFDIYALDELTAVLKQPVRPVLVSERELYRALDVLYRNTQEMSHFADALSGELAEQLEVLTLAGEANEGNDAPVMKLLMSLFKDAAISEASDIHIEPGEDALRIRLRIDGMLQEKVLEDTRLARPLIQRLKMRAKLDISERRLPQDGRFNLNVHSKSFDVRVSTLPVSHGESLVMRLLDQSAPVQALDELGMPVALIKRISRIYSGPHGMLLVTGPTGSGKTTTLYSILSKLNTSQRKIITVEDPVEYHLPRINQVQVNPKIGLDFASVLRATLRQDPDILMVGEIRDLETARIAMRAAVTGHLVLATLHTHDVTSAALRLMDMGAHGYMVASSLRGIIAQRLVRLLCTHCAQLYSPTEEELQWLNIPIKETFEPFVFKRNKGCSACYQTGYKGRTGVYEFLELNPEIAATLRHNDPQAFAIKVATHPEYSSLKRGVADLVCLGQTSFEEAVRVVGELTDEIT